MENDKEMLDFVVNAINGLPEKYNYVVKERYFNQREYKSIAEEIGLTVWQVRSRINTGLTIINKMWAAYQLGKTNPKMKEYYVKLVKKYNKIEEIKINENENKRKIEENKRKKEKFIVSIIKSNEINEKND